MLSLLCLQESSNFHAFDQMNDVCLNVLSVINDINQIQTIINQMKRSSSMQGFKFASNPHQFKIGESRIDSLPIRMTTRRSSLNYVGKGGESEGKSQMEVLRGANSALRAQNEKLRRQIEYLQQRNMQSVMKTQQKVSAYRDLIKNKFTSRTKTSRVTTEAETGLFSSKEVSLDRTHLTIDELYQSYKFSNKPPSLLDLAEITDRFFKDYCDHYAKIKTLFQCINTDRKSIQYQKLSQLIDLYKVPLLYQKSPQTLFRELSKSKDKIKGKKQKEQLCLQVLSPHQTVLKFQGLLQKLCKSSQMIRLLRSNEHVSRFIAKIEGGKH